ncbi:ABA4-like family protein [Algoriphagus machipongonensis]|uniref:Integral membrane protein n=1 Tax=Algoriphagus machipongonensis TaxID=388413 RepID=A3HVQ6_9BACT|nr:ABA4-like family protein [Algoriphagus machipongonensis]EAZ82228.1 putative integral membrane protein [Algoriphagus machipongonensis]
MKLELIFTIVNTIAFLCWVFLFALYQKRWVYQLLFSITFVILGIAYLFFIIRGMGAGTGGNFDSLAHVRLLFESDEALLAGWIHYLVFDLFVGMWISHNADQRKINRWILFPCLVLTFMAGPAGLLLYIIIRVVHSKKWIQEPFSNRFTS